MNDLEAFGRWVKVNRKALGMTQEEFARMVYCAPITLRKIESGQLRPSRELACFIIEAVGATQGEFEALMSAARARPLPIYGGAREGGRGIFALGD